MEEGKASVSPPAMTLSLAIDGMDKVPMVKAKATHVIMNSLLTKQTQESIQHFEQQAGLRVAGYTPHMGLPIEETKYFRVVEALHKVKVQGGEKQTASAQSTPSSTPTFPRGWFSSGSFTAFRGQNLSTMDSGIRDKDRNLADKWRLFGPRALQKSDLGGFAIQAYRGAQKPSASKLIHVQATRMAKDPTTFKLPKMDIPVIRGKKQSPMGPESHTL